MLGAGKSVGNVSERPDCDGDSRAAPVTPSLGFRCDVKHGVFPLGYDLSREREKKKVLHYFKSSVVLAFLTHIWSEKSLCHCFMNLG